MKRILTALTLLLSTATAFGNPVPQRAISSSQFTTEILLSIGAEKQMIGTAFLDDQILPSLKKSYDSIPVLSKRAPSKEYFYSLNPDFLTGWKSIITPKYLGPLEELEENAVQVYIPKSQDSSDIEVIFQDILAYGKIFNLEKNSENLVNKMKSDYENVKNDKISNPPKVFAYDSGTSAPMVVGGTSIGNTIIEMAGGNNIFKNLKGGFPTANWETILAQDPKYIIVIDYGDETYDSKIKFLKENSPIKDISAIKNNNFIKVGLSDLSPGVRVIETIKTLHEKFKQ
ncbi:ABC transporter substrate-binding protein [Cetobacterium sp. SF1]|uniref:ABC transporter substrate-binding protein n=1 Tax=unclassified Cetobacterium TaxID=2630983 RepID=UPI003CF14F43